MRQNKALIIEFVIGIILAGVGLGTEFDYYSTLIFATGFGLAAGSVRQILRIWYWNSPGRRDEYEMKKREAYINSVDERRKFLQMKASQISAWIMLFVLLWVSDVAAFRYLEKRM